MYPKLLWMLLIFSASFLTTQAQKYFTEGILYYNVTIDPPPGAASSAKYKGVYTIMVKGKMLRKELIMDNGFRNVMLYANNKDYALRSSGNKNFAVEIDAHQQEQNNKNYSSFTLTDNGEKQNIATLNCKGATVTYKNGESTNIYYSPDWKTEDFVFDRFPGIQVLPLSFSYKNEDGSTIHFEAEKIEQKPVEGSSFKIPDNYKIISSEEYARMDH